MHTQLHNNALRYTRYAAFAWLSFLTSFGLSQFGNLIYGELPVVHQVLGVLAQGSFGAGCIGIVGTLGMRVFSRATTL